MDIGFGDTIAVGGVRYRLVFVDRTTRYNWVSAFKVYPQISSSPKAPSTQILPWEDWRSIKYARYTTKQCPIPVPPVTKDEVSQNKVPPVGVAPPIATSPPAAVPVSDTDLSKMKLLSTMSGEDIPKHVQHPDTTLPGVCPCDTLTGSDKKTHYLAEEFHRITGCLKFKNYEHLVKATQDDPYVDRGEFPLSLGSYSTLRKSKYGKAIDHTKY